MLFFLAYLLTGAFAGFLAGLFGVGGGTIIVPMLLWLLPQAGIPEAQVMTVALGTSFATIVMTAFSSAHKHHQLNNVDFRVFQFFVPALMISVFIAGWFVTFLPKMILMKMFAVMMLYLSVKMFLSHKPSSSLPQQNKPLTPQVQIIAGTIIGMLASFAGIGGGAFIVPFLNERGFEMKRAIGTSSACGILLGLGASISFMLSGQNVQNMPDYSIGFVYLPAFFGISMASVLTSKIGASVANRLPVTMLKRAFSLFLCFIAILMFFK